MQTGESTQKTCRLEVARRKHAESAGQETVRLGEQCTFPRRAVPAAHRSTCTIISITLCYTIFHSTGVFTFHDVLYCQHTESIYKPLASEQACSNI